MAQHLRIRRGYQATLPLIQIWPQQSVLLAQPGIRTVNHDGIVQFLASKVQLIFASLLSGRRITALTTLADEKLPLLEVNGDVFTNVIVTKEGSARFESARAHHVAFVREHFLSRFTDAELLQMADFWKRLNDA